MNMLDYTWQCDGYRCERETTVRHERGAGVYCEACAKDRIRYSFGIVIERKEQEETRDNQRAVVPQID
jgi:hypothetical protein